MYTVFESREGESSTHGGGGAGEYELIYYVSQYSCIAYIMSLKPTLAWNPRSFRNNDTYCFLDNVFETTQIRKCLQTMF